MSMYFQIRINMQTHYGLQEKDTEYTYTYDITEEITAFRHIIRDLKYLQHHSLTTLSNKPLDSYILHFSEHKITRNRIIHTLQQTNFHPD